MANDKSIVDPILQLDYEQTQANFRMLADIRFKLLALVPALSGVAIAVLAKDLQAETVAHEIIMIASLLGFVVTMGITFYDQRNSQISNATFFRLRALETRLKFTSRHGGQEIGGLMLQRPGHTLRFFGI